MTKETCIKQMNAAKTPELKEFWRARAIRKGAKLDEPKEIDNGKGRNKKTSVRRN